MQSNINKNPSVLKTIKLTSERIRKALINWHRLFLHFISFRTYNFITDIFKIYYLNSDPSMFDEFIDRFIWC